MPDKPVLTTSSTSIADSSRKYLSTLIDVKVDRGISQCRLTHNGRLLPDYVAGMIELFAQNAGDLEEILQEALEVANHHN